MTPFYKKALALFTRTQEQQIAKGLAKYPEPFNPHSWTPNELLNHALEETVDLTHYLVGLKDLLDEKDKEIARLKRYESAYLNVVANKPLDTSLLIKKKSPFEEQYDMNFNPHFDQDDQ
jgi:hypothetical protein